VTRSVRLYAIIAAAIVLVGTGVFVGIRLLTNEVNNSIPQTDLFGDGTPSPSATSPSATPTPSATPLPGSDIKGPLNILIAGLDTREWIKTWVPHSDAVMILHVNKDLTKGYLTSLPRDLVVNIPSFAPAHFSGQRTKLTHAMSFGSRVPGSNRPNPAQGFQLLAKTVSNYTGITRFDAGAILTFNGLRRFVDQIGGFDLYVDQKVTSIHMQPNGHHKPACSGCAHGYGGPSMVYNVGLHHFSGWQALDYSRQRYLPGADYTRQRHQRQVIKAIIAKAFSADMFTNPAQMERVLKALGKTLTFDGRGHTPIDFAFALRNMRTDKLTLIGLPGSGAYSGGKYIGENLNGVQASYFAALRADNLDSFVASHRSLVNSTRM
jgi:LCP family protein required for cell wall assembly